MDALFGGYTDETANNIYVFWWKGMTTRSHVTWGSNKADMSFED